MDAALTDLSFLEQAGVHIQPGALLAEYTTFRIGGTCLCLITCQTPKQLEATMAQLNTWQIDFILIGGGSNLLVSDSGINCIVVRYVSEKPLIRREGNDVIVSGSTSFDELVVFALQNSLEGLNYASGIPGTVGGAIVGNAGAFGKQVGDYLKSATLISKKGIKFEANPKDLGFKYRDSDLKKTVDIVVEARFGLLQGNREALQKEREEILKLRHEKHPDLKAYPSAGSFFRNIEPTSKAERRQAAGWFLEQAGAKHMRVGGAVVFEKHANIIVKSNGCTAQNVFELSKLMSQAVKKHFNLDLVREVRLVGKFDGMPLDVQGAIW